MKEPFSLLVANLRVRNILASIEVYECSFASYIKKSVAPIYLKKYSVQ